MATLSIVYEDQDLLLADKPQGLSTTPGDREDLCGLVFNQYPELAEIKGFHQKEAGLLNRLDHETGGLVFFAKTQKAFDYYSLEMREERIEKIYCAWVWGILGENHGAISFPVAHHPKNSAKMVCVTHPKTRFRGKPREAVTFFEKIRENQNKKATLLLLKIQKGARHQIRVHLAAAGFPIVGDRLYGTKDHETTPEHHLLYAVGAKWKTPDGKEQEIRISPPFENGF